jgi:hypothetical protein
MRTPSGRECALYYEDFNRGVALQECRVERGPGSQPWRPPQCERCPVPDILLANGSPWLKLVLAVRKRPVGGSRFEVEAWCGRHAVPVNDPYVGCPECANEELSGLLG